MDAVVSPLKPIDSGLRALAGIAGFYRIPVDVGQLERDGGLTDREADGEDVLRAAKRLGLKARIVRNVTPGRLARVPCPAILRRRDGGFVVLGGSIADKGYRIVDPVSRLDALVPPDELLQLVEPHVILVARGLVSPGHNPATFGFRWFLPSLKRYRRPLANVLLASLFLQLFALVTPLFFQVVIDKVLPHKGYETLLVMVAGIALLGLFDVVLQYLRTYMLAHTTNRIDVELGQRLFRHLLSLPVAYFERRSAGQTVARLRELENIRSFMTGQGLFSVIDLVFTFVFLSVMCAYSWRLTLIVIASIPLYLLIAALVRPSLKAKVNERFDRGAQSQQFMVETVVGAQTLKACAVEPLVQSQWEEKLAAYVRTAFDATLVGAGGQGAIQYVSKLTTALLLLFGAKAVIDGDLTVGGLIAFNMVAGQVTAPILRLSQIWQDFQQVQISVERLGDILNAPTEFMPRASTPLPPPKGDIVIKDVRFRYQPSSPDVLRGINLTIGAGEVVGIVGPSGSGKSTLTNLLQRFYLPDEGRIFLDGVDLAHCDPAWLRSHIGVVLQENLLFNRTIHENIALATPAMPRAQVMAIAKLAGADEFIGKLPLGYDTTIEERGTNLSGGQRQRIAIARALAANPRILILDEATSALDYESEHLIQKSMRQIVQNRTVIIIAHRLAAVRACDRIIGMVDGRIVESGSHDELLTREAGLYARLWSIQNASHNTSAVAA